jgi:hypothetical protein
MSATSNLASGGACAEQERGEERGADAWGPFEGRGHGGMMRDGFGWCWLRCIRWCLR